MLIAIKLAWRSLKNDLRFSLFFILNLSLALSGLIVLYSLQESANRSLTSEAKNLLGGDLYLSSHQNFEDDSLQEIEKRFTQIDAQSHQVKLFSMVASTERSKLTHIIGIDSNFPLYGKLTLTTGTLTKDQKEAFASTPQIWASTEALQSLQTTSNENVRIGEINFQIAGIIDESPTEALSLFAGIPKIYVHISQLEKTNLLKFGSRIRYIRFYKLSQSTEFIEEQVKQVKAIWKAKLKDLETMAEIRVRTPQSNNSQFGELIQRFASFLGLTALTALFLGGVGVAYLFRHFLENQLQSFAVLMTLGSSRQQAQMIVVIQLIFLGIAGSLLAIGVTATLISLGNTVIQT